MKPVDTRPALGMQLLTGFVAVDGGDPAKPPTEWEGQLYNRENGKTYHCTLRVSTAENARGELLLHPYVGIPLFGKTLRWPRSLAPVAVPSGATQH